MKLQQLAFSQAGTLLKGNLHTHTTRSDGALSPEETIQIYEDKGFDFLALTDHRLYNRQPAPQGSRLLLLPGMELDATVPDTPVHCLHLVSIGSDTQNAFQQDQTFRSERVTQLSDAQHWIDEILAANNLPIVCHPEWSGMGYSEVSALQRFSLMEIWNSGCALDCMLDRNAAYWDELLNDGRIVYGVATDDCHAVSHMGVGAVYVRAERTTESIVEALKNGAFYASCGPKIEDFYVEDGEAHIRCSEAVCIRFRHFRWPAHVCMGTRLTEASVRLPESIRYIRAEVYDDQGRCAWTNPIFLDR